MGLSTPFPVSQEGAAALLSLGVSCVLQLPTGSGKTHLAWQAIQQEVARGNRAIFLAPLKALAEQLFQRWQAERPDLRIGVYSGDHPKALPLPEAQVLIMTPERLDACIRRWRHHWSWLSQVGLLVVDEFHLLGEGRRGARLEGTLLRFERLNPLARLIGLSATLGNRRELATWWGAAEYISEERAVPLVWTSVRYANPQAKPQLLTECLKASPMRSLVFVQSRRRAEVLAEFLTGQGLSVQHHHAGLEPTERQQIEQAFLTGELETLVCTSTLELGLNLPCRRVVLYDIQQFNGRDFIPLRVNQAWQRAGRAGRYGLDPQGEVVVFHAAWEKETIDYPAGCFEAIDSQLAQPGALLEQVVVDLASGYARTQRQLERHHQRSLAFKQNRLPQIAPLIEQAVQAELLERQEEKTLTVTAAAHVAVRHQLAPETVLLLKRELKQAETPFDLLLLLTGLPDQEIRLPVDFEALPRLGTQLASLSSIWLSASPAQLAGRLALQPRELLHLLHTAHALWQLTQGKTPEEVAEQHDAYPYEIRRLQTSTLRLVQAAQDLTGEDPIMQRRLGTLQAMVSAGLPEEPAQLTRVVGIGNHWAKILHLHGITDLESLALSDVQALSTIPRLGRERAGRWIDEAALLIKDWTEVWLPGRPPELQGASLDLWVDPYRLRRAADLTVQSGDTGFRVTGGHEPHRVGRQGDTLNCDCLDFHNGHTCKHILAVQLRTSKPLQDLLDQLQGDPHAHWNLPQLWMQR